MTNMTKIASGMYLVRTQAGFRKAIKHQFSNTFEDWKEMMKDMKKFPKEYPAVVVLGVGYNGSWHFQCKSVHVNTVKAVLDKA